MPDARIGVVGATGAVGTVTLRLLRERGYRNVRAFASARSAGQELDDGVGGRGSHAGGARRGRPRPRALLLRHGRLARARPTRGRGWCSRRRQVERVPARGRLPARRARGERRTCARGDRDDAGRGEPELLDDPAHVRLKPLHDAAGLRSVRALDLPGRLGRGRAEDGATAGRASRTSTTSNSTGRGKATRPRRNRRSAPKRARSSSFRSCRSARPPCAYPSWSVMRSRCGWRPRSRSRPNRRSGTGRSPRRAPRRNAEPAKRRANPGRARRPDPPGSRS